MNILIGKRSVYEALRSEQKIDRIVVDFRLKRDKDIDNIAQLARQTGIKLQYIKTDAFQRLTTEKNTQGIVAYFTAKTDISLDTLLKNSNQYPFVVAIDHLQDPYNFGAILRTSEILGVKAVIYPKDRNVTLTPGVLKTASGATNYLPLSRVTNLARSIQLLKDAGYWIYGADSNDGTNLEQVTLNFPAVIVVGNEEKGLQKNVLSKLDERINIPMVGKVQSLNVSVATGIILYSFSRSLYQQ